jgi:hypothetical protein
MGEYEKYVVTEYDIRQSIMLIALKVFDIAGRMETQYGERPFPETEFPDAEVFYCPEKEFKKSISKELLGWIAIRLAAQTGSEALIHSEEYERSDDEPIYQIWTPEHIKKHSELAFYGLGGNETACVTGYLKDLEALRWINRIIAEQTEEPAADGAAIKPEPKLWKWFDEVRKDTEWEKEMIRYSVKEKAGCKKEEAKNNGDTKTAFYKRLRSRIVSLVDDQAKSQGKKPVNIVSIPNSVEKPFRDWSQNRFPASPAENSEK